MMNICTFYAITLIELRILASGKYNLAYTLTFYNFQMMYKEGVSRFNYRHAFLKKRLNH